MNQPVRHHLALLGVSALLLGATSLGHARNDLKQADAPVARLVARADDLRERLDSDFARDALTRRLLRLQLREIDVALAQITGGETPPAEYLEHLVAEPRGPHRWGSAGP